MGTDAVVTLGPAVILIIENRRAVTWPGSRRRERRDRQEAFACLASTLSGRRAGRPGDRLAWGPLRQDYRHAD